MEGFIQQRSPEAAFQDAGTVFDHFQKENHSRGKRILSAAQLDGQFVFQTTVNITVR